MQVQASGHGTYIYIYIHIVYHTIGETNIRNDIWQLLDFRFKNDFQGLEPICSKFKTNLNWPIETVEFDEFKYDADIREGLKNKELLVKSVFDLTNGPYAMSGEVPRWLIDPCLPFPPPPSAAIFHPSPFPPALCGRGQRAVFFWNDRIKVDLGTKFSC